MNQRRVGSTIDVSESLSAKGRLTQVRVRGRDD
jgi:hypothetical protein